MKKNFKVDVIVDSTNAKKELEEIKVQLLEIDNIITKIKKDLNLINKNELLSSKLVERRNKLNKVIGGEE